MVLTEAKIGQTFKVKRVEGKEKTKKFLLTLGCFEGEQITLISKLSGNFVVNIKDSRYAIEPNIAKIIVLEV
ncbi:ferrous iron transport protein A [Anaeromicrobium sediminis]|uniref:Ferrous iron transport protein A n=2 Tax=Anaeromicrobium sediminis TaxID=1478221 RepID=A0A267MM63_9FIRM|nr:ferrous iron transport protein A [Anaeromicrobium sediminis]